MTETPDWTAAGAAEGWEGSITLGGGALRALDPVARLAGPARGALGRRLGQVLLAVHDPRPAVSDGGAAANAVVAVGRRILQRGGRPPPDPGTERELLRRSGLDDLRPCGLPGDLATLTGPRTVAPGADGTLAAAVWGAADFEPAILCRGPRERLFKWARARCGDEAARWLTVAERESNDLLFAPPWREPLLIGLEQEGPVPAAADAGSRRAARAAPGVIEQIPLSEVMALQGPALDRLARILTPPTGGEADRELLTLVYGPALFTWLGLAVMEAVARRWLAEGGTWRIQVADPLGLIELLLRPVLELLAAVDGLFGAGLAPDRCEVRRGQEKPVAFERSGPASYAEARPGAAFRRPDAEILLEPERGPIDALPEAGRHPLLVARSAALPGTPAAIGPADRRPAALAQDPDLLEPCLGRLLTTVFAKRSFREGQLVALTRVLSGQDCVVHLPPGAGKSIVYQLAGLLMAGTTVVVEPDAGLIDDQLRSLRQHGIRRVRVLDPGPLDEEGEEGGEEPESAAAAPGVEPLFCYVHAETLRRERPRQMLADLAAAARLALFVVDEAHAVSEWSHDFRLSYQAVRQVLAGRNAEGRPSPPPVLALTGTASRRVARDILGVLAGARDPEALVRAASMHRSELGFELLSAPPEGAHAALYDHLRRLPRRFEMPEARFFGPGGEERPQGIVFCQAADGPRGPAEVWRRLGARLGGEAVGVWAPAPPEGMPREEFEHQRARHFDSFRRGELALLVATPELGIGTSVPGVRYVVHLGFPGSLEAYAQQAGRAGHDGRPAVCAILYVGRSSPEVDRLLDPGLEGEAVRARLRAHGAALEAEEDLRRQLERHLAAFPGRRVEMTVVKRLLERLDWTGEGGALEMALEGDAAHHELALYRLSLLGIATSWSRHGDNATLAVRTATATADDLDAALLGFVERTRPSRELEYQERLAGLESPTLRDRAERLAAMVLDLVYEAIEPARRASLRAMWQLVRTASSPRQLARMVDGGLLVEKLAPRIDGLLEDTEVEKLSGWLELLVELTVQDAGELEAAVERSFAEHPGHPGLLLAAAAARLFRHHSRASFFESIEAFMTAARQGGRVDWVELRQASVWLARRAREIAPSWAVGPWLVWEEAGGPPHLLRVEEMAALRDEAQAPAEAVVVLARRLAEAGSIARSLGEHFHLEAGEV